MSRFTRRDWVGLVLALAAVLAVFLGYQWNAAVSRNRSGAAEPFRIAGNFYYVGGNDPAVFLITGPEGHVLIDGGWPETAPLVMMGALTFVAFTPTGPMDEFSALPIQIFNWSSRPQKQFHELAAAGIIVLLVVLLLMNATAIMIRNRSQRNRPW